LLDGLGQQEPGGQRNFYSKLGLLHHRTHNVHKNINIPTKNQEFVKRTKFMAAFLEFFLLLFLFTF
jgi:hypothetical protein